MDPTVERLRSLLEAVWRQRPETIDPDRSLREQGLDSVALIAFLSRIEREFDFEWRPEAPSAGLRSLRSIAAVLREEGVGT